jgi:pilus assembly protein Flp/PilA
MRYIQKFIQEEAAATAVEYAVMLALILMTMILAIQSFGGTIASMFGTANTEIDTHFN